MTEVFHNFWTCWKTPHIFFLGEQIISQPAVWDPELAGTDEELLEAEPGLCQRGDHEVTGLALLEPKHVLQDEILDWLHLRQHSHQVVEGGAPGVLGHLPHPTPLFSFGPVSVFTCLSICLPCLVWGWHGGDMQTRSGARDLTYSGVSPVMFLCRQGVSG